jgi:hypothetical protein
MSIGIVVRTLKVRYRLFGDVSRVPAVSTV